MGIVIKIVIGMRRVAPIVALTAVALGASTAGATPVQQVAGIAAQQAVPSNPQQARAQVALMAPSVGAAIKAGEGAKVLALAANGNLAVAAGLVPYVTGSKEASPPSGKSPLAFAARTRHARAHAAGCYGSPNERWTWTVAGVKVGWVYVRANGWCGSGGRITWYGGATFAHWTQSPWCIAGEGTDYSWDRYPSWIHMMNWGTLGLSYAWGCAGYHGGKANLRIAWNGYWDSYDDFGF